MLFFAMPSLGELGLFCGGIASLITVTGLGTIILRLWPRVMAYVMDRTQLHHEWETARRIAVEEADNLRRAHEAIDLQKIAGQEKSERLDRLEARILELEAVKARFDVLVEWIQVALPAARIGAVVPPLPDILRDHVRIPEPREAEPIEAIDIT